MTEHNVTVENTLQVLLKEKKLNATFWVLSLIKLNFGTIIFSRFD